MLAWMLYVIFITLLLDGSALAADRAQLRARGGGVGAVAGAGVYIARGVGPGVVGLLRPRIVIPRWLTESPSVCQELVIAHEQAHLARHDPQILTLALFLLVVMPWNVPLWWQLRRLRRAIEVDSDARALEKGLDLEKYRQMLTDVSRRPSAYFAMAASTPDAPSLLQQRMRLMIDPAHRGPVAAPMFVLLAFALVAVAAQVTPPNVDNSAAGAPHTLILAPDVLDASVASYARSGHAVIEISLQTTRLFA